MDDDAGVGMTEGVEQRQQELPDLAPSAWNREILEGALDELHGEPWARIDGVEVVDQHDARMIQRGHGADLVAQGGPSPGSSGPPDDLQRDVLAEAGVASPVDLAHAAPAHEPEELEGSDVHA